MIDPGDSVPPPALAPGTQLAHYRIVRPVGAGGMGVVYLARDIELERDAAVKVLRPDVLDGKSGIEEQLRERFLREARSAARLNHPNVASVYQVGRERDLVFIAMEWIDGGSLSDHLEKNVFLDWRDATSAVRDAAAGLAAAHHAGIIHRDIKPSNLMRTASGLVKIVDFGLARDHRAVSNLTQADTVLGTPAYLSPEQCRGEAATPLSDLYSLACTYFNLLTSRPPFDATNVPGLLHQQINQPMPDPRRFAGDIPPPVCEILQRAAAKSPADRYPSAAAMLADLNAVLEAASRPVEIPKTVKVTPIAAVAVPNNLPIEATTFIGRDRELAEARTQLDAHRLCTLTGPGGTGKTRLAIQAGRQALPLFPDGVWWVELAAIPQGAADGLAAAVGGTLGVGETAGRTIVDGIVEHLAVRRTLLILDNCEHVIEAAARLTASILARCPQVRLLATSRQPLRTEGEAIVPVPPLATPTADDLPLAALGECGSVRLFVERATAARPAFALTRENAAAIAQICRRLDGIPLAIELAAARVKVLSAQQITGRLGEAFKLLTGGSRTLLPRQQTLRALIDWSYDLLAEPARVALARLSVFAGGCTLEAAEFILADDALPADQVLDLLAELVEQSLVIADERDGAIRYRMLETIRQYAAEKLLAAPGAENVRYRHAEHFTAVSAATVSEISGAHQSRAMALFDADHDNFRSALDFATDRRHVELAVRLGAGLSKFWWIRGLLAEGIARLEAVLRLDLPGSGDLARLLDGAAMLAMYHGERGKAADWFHRALSMASEQNEQQVVGLVLNNLGTLAKEQGDLHRAEALYEQALDVRRHVGDRRGEAGSLNNLGIIAKLLGDLGKCRRFLKLASVLTAELGDRRWVGYGDLNLAEVELDEGDIDAARRLYQSSLTIMEDLKEDWGVSYALEGLGKCSQANGDLAEAQRQFSRTLEIVRKLGDQRVVADQLDNLADLAGQQNDLTAATSLSAESMTLRIRIRDELGLAKSMESQAARTVNGDCERAARFLGAAAKLRTKLGVPVVKDKELAQTELISALRQRLGAPVYDAAYALGQTSEAADLV